MYIHNYIHNYIHTYIHTYMYIHWCWCVSMDPFPFQGGVVGIEIAWNCNLDWKLERCDPEYSFRRSDLLTYSLGRGRIVAVPQTICELLTVEKCRFLPQIKLGQTPFKAPPHTHTHTHIHRLDDPDVGISKGFNFRFARYHLEEGVQTRTLYKAYGILFKVVTTGRVCIPRTPLPSLSTPINIACMYIIATPLREIVLRKYTLYHLTPMSSFSRYIPLSQ